MRSGLSIATVIVLGLIPTRGTAQDASVAGARALDSADNQAVVRQSTASTAALRDRVQQLVDRIRPLQERLVRDDRLRTAEGVVGVGIAAYEASRVRSGLPLGFIGAEALRLGLHHQLTVIRRETGYSVEPSIGRGSFAISFHKTLE
jgi:hypothetical protein